MTGAQRLEHYWKGRPTNLLGFDFHNQALDHFRAEDGYAMMNLFRICQTTIDQWVASSLPLNGVAEEIARDAIVRQPALRNDIPRLNRTTRALVKRDYGQQISEAMIDAPVRAARAI